MKSFYVNRATGDIELDGQNVHKMIDGDDELMQCVRTRFETNKGEWFADPEHGFKRKVTQAKHYKEDEVRQEVQDTALQEERVDSIVEMDFKYDKERRKLEVDFVFTKENGDTVEGGF